MFVRRFLQVYAKINIRPYFKSIKFVIKKWKILFLKIVSIIRQNYLKLLIINQLNLNFYIFVN